MKRSTRRRALPCQVPSLYRRCCECMVCAEGHSTLDDWSISSFIYCWSASWPHPEKLGLRGRFLVGVQAILYGICSVLALVGAACASAADLRLHVHRGALAKAEVLRYGGVVCIPQLHHALCVHLRFQGHTHRKTCLVLKPLGSRQGCGLQLKSRPTDKAPQSPAGRQILPPAAAQVLRRMFQQGVDKQKMLGNQREKFF